MRIVPVRWSMVAWSLSNPCGRQTGSNSMPDSISRASRMPGVDTAFPSSTTPSGETGERQTRTAQSPGHGAKGPAWWAGLFFGAATQLFFLWTAWHLFLFLRDGAFARSAFRPWFDTFLAFLFIAPHSLLLFPKVQSALRLWLPAAWLGCLHCLRYLPLPLAVVSILDSQCNNPLGSPGIPTHYHAIRLLWLLDWTALQSLAYGDGIPDWTDSLMVLAKGPETTASGIP